MLNVKKIQILSYALLFLPFLLFSVGWLKPLLALLTVALVLLLFCRLIKSELADEEFVTVSKREFITIIVVALLITWLGGIGGYFPQSEDQYMRNAIYRDLILEKWPVFYEQTNRALVYYFGFWLLPASVCKLFLPVTTEYGIWLMARGVLFLFTFFYITVILLMLIAMLSRASEKKHGIFLICVLVLIWGNLAIVGTLFSKILNSSTFYDSIAIPFRYPLLIEHWANKFAVSNGNLIQVMNVFNQALPAWLGTILFLYNKEKVKVWGAISLPLILCAPFPMCGIAAMMFMEWILLLKTRKIRLAEIFSVENILSIIFIAIIIPFYAGTVSSKISITGFWIPINNTVQEFAIILLFSLLTFEVYGIFVTERKTMFFWMVEFLNFIFCFIMFGASNDFKLRATIPFSIYFMVCVIRLMLYEQEKLWRKKVIAIMLLIMAAVPILNIYSLLEVAANAGTLTLENDKLYTLSSVAGEGDNTIIHQYTKFNPSKDIFFRYFSKGEYMIDNPVVEYIEDAEENIYVSKIALTSDMIDLVCANIQSTGNVSVADMLENVNYDGIEVIEFAGDVIPITQNEVMRIDDRDIDIVWSNYPNRSIAAIDLSYYGKDSIKYGNGSGISISLTDQYGNIVCSPYAIAYTKHIIYGNSKQKYLVPLPQLKETGEYYLKVSFFYTNALDQKLIIEDNTRYKIVIK